MSEKEFLDKLCKTLDSLGALLKCYTTRTKECINSVVKEVSLLKDIDSEKITGQTEIKETSNPFTLTNKRIEHVWEKKSLDTIEYCSSETSPKSHQTLAYLISKLPPYYTQMAVRRKLHRLGIRVKKGYLCKI
ncbi:hypothetical protein CFT13S00388_02690 [Campylobacter fetus subsp. testudinum]|uniref:hypothetical protein n=1 Tax=Campylobacter fetus TaxID=196 RepID=UPI000818A57C|nr:hypothetical protein [Campylobacter fetus]OCR88091.1 hypothetical protein CFT13S00388_02690 [Campylobacter fetus subsp. testudinum]